MDYEVESENLMKIIGISLALRLRPKINYVHYSSMRDPPYNIIMHVCLALLMLMTTGLLREKNAMKEIELMAFD